MISSFWKKSGSRLADSRCGLGCNLLLSRRLLRCGLLSGLDRRRCLRFLGGGLLGLRGSKSGFGFGQKVDFAFAWNGCVSSKDKTESKPGEFVIRQSVDGGKQNLFGGLLVVFVVSSKVFGYVIEGIGVDTDKGAEKHPQLGRAEHGRCLVENPVELGYTRL